MSFRIVAYGVPHFHYHKENLYERGDFDALKTLTILQGMEPTTMGVVGAAADKFAPSVDSTDLMGTLATMEALHLLNDSVGLLAIRPNMNNAVIRIKATNTHVFWADTVMFTYYNFRPGEHPGAEFFRAISPTLNDTDLNDWGVLMALAQVLSKYNYEISEHTMPKIGIELTK